MRNKTSVIELNWIQIHQMWCGTYTLTESSTPGLHSQFTYFWIHWFAQIGHAHNKRKWIERYWQWNECDWYKSVPMKWCSLAFFAISFLLKFWGFKFQAWSSKFLHNNLKFLLSNSKFLLGNSKFFLGYFNTPHNNMKPPHHTDLI